MDELGIMRTLRNILIAILSSLIISFLLGLAVYGQTNELSEVNPPTPTEALMGGVSPIPHYFPAPDSAEGEAIDAEAALLSAYAQYKLDIRPSPRVLMSDGRIIKWSPDAIEWHIESPFFRVEWTDELTTNTMWETVGYRTGNKLTHNKADGFYRVIPCKRPTLPPTLPAKCRPSPTTDTFLGHTNATTGAKVEYTPRVGGFRRYEEPVNL